VRTTPTGTLALAAFLVAASCLLVVPASAVVPEAERIARATAKANKAAARSQALQLELTLRVAERDPIGAGKLVTHPTGLARLELRDAADRVERHLLVGTEHDASRDGEELERPRAFLPPLFLLQVDSPATFEQALSDFGLDVEAAALAPCGKRVCYVLGDPARVAPPPPPTPEELAEMEAVEARGESVRGQIIELEPDIEEPDPDAPARPVPSLWVDTRTFEIVRIESRGGIVVEFGPTVEFGDVRFPDFFTIQEPEREPIRFDILGVTPVNAPAAGFQRAWLMTPPEPDPDSRPEPAAAPEAPSGLR
jgi:hypothetical protein